MENVAETKLLDFNLEKSCYTIFGSNRRRQEIEEELRNTPLILGGKKMVKENSIKYLGDILSSKGLAESAESTINSREGLTKRAIYDIRSIIDDCRIHLTGGLKSGLELWELSVIPSLLNNAETWQDIKTRSVNKLEKLQITFLRCLFAVGSGCPTPLLYSETGTVLMEFRILKKKLMFLHHLYNLPNTSLAYEVLSCQAANDLPGIIHECKNFLDKFNLNDLTLYSKSQFKRIVNSNINVLNRQKLIQQVKSKQYKKIDIAKFESDRFEVKPYILNLNVTDARLKFKINSYMVPTIKMNFQSDFGFSNKLWACDDCLENKGIGNRDSQNHVINCSAYKDFRQNKNLDCDRDLIDYYKLVLKRRSR